MSNFLAQADVGVDAVVGAEGAIDQTLGAGDWWLGGGVIALVLVLVAWTMIWKAIALWKAARNGSKVWYVIMFLVNTAGILEIIYIFAVAKKTEVSKGSQTPQAPTAQV